MNEDFYKKVLFISPNGISEIAVTAKKRLKELIEKEIKAVWQTYDIDEEEVQKDELDNTLQKYKQILMNYSEIIIHGEIENWDNILNQLKITTENKIIVGRINEQIFNISDSLVFLINKSQVTHVSVDLIQIKNELLQKGVIKEILVEKYSKFTNGTFYNKNKCDTSIEEQNPTAKIINLPYTKTDFYFNSAIFERNNEILLMTRHSKIVDEIKKEPVWKNTLKLFQLNNEFEFIKEIPFEIKDEFKNEQYEDPRVLFFNDKYYVSCVNYIPKVSKYAHQKILIFDKDFNHIDNLHLDYCGNGYSTNFNEISQKNWTWFVHENKLMMVYKMQPHTVVEIDLEEKEVVNEYRTFNKFIDTWLYGEPRMGSNPIYKDGYYHNFFHSSLPWKGPKRQYFMGYYKFEACPPFKIVEMSEEPILCGNGKNERVLPKLSPIVIFPCGAIERDGQFIVSYGINDEKTGIIKI
jgi:predicted GH43/DUF377 family glycosyl hydrolase